MPVMDDVLLAPQLASMVSGFFLRFHCAASAEVIVDLGKRNRRGVTTGAAWPGRQPRPVPDLQSLFISVRALVGGAVGCGLRVP